MASHYIGGETKETKRYKLGRLAGSLARHFVLMTATPHAGIGEDFQLFLALLDGDRFGGKPRDASHAIDASDLMRRLVVVTESAAARATSRCSGARAWSGGPCRGRGQPPRRSPRGAEGEGCCRYSTRRQQVRRRAC